MKISWKTSKQLLKVGKSNHNISSLEMNNEYAETYTQKVDMLNRYFDSQMDLDDKNRPLPHIPPNEDALVSIVITVEDVKDVPRNLNVNKACDPALINPRLFKEGATLIAMPLSIIFNRSLEHGYFPTCWKYRNVTPICREDAKYQLSNYRPIILLCS